MRAIEEHDYLDYSKLIDSFEVEVLRQDHDDDYSGDSRYLLRDGERYGLLFFGWGSCSGCDALQACGIQSEVTELRDLIWGYVHWENSATELIRYITDKDWSLDFRGDDSRPFLSGVIALLSS